MSRIRTFVDSSNRQSEPSYYHEDGGWNYEGPFWYDATVSYRAMEDIVTPDFKARQAEGQIINNPMLLSDRSLSQSPDWATGTGACACPNVSYLTYGMPVPVESDLMPPYRIDTLTARQALHLFLDEHFGTEAGIAITQSWANVDESEILALASIAELPETLRWIQSILKRAMNILRMFRSRKWQRLVARSRKVSLDDVSDFWLEFRYAFRPLVYEMEQARQALENLIEKHARITARGFHEAEEKRTDIVFRGQFNGVVNQYSTYHSGTWTRSSNYRAGVLYAIDDDINGMAATWGLDRPLEAAYEVVPFSFIVDWFFNIGDVLASWSVNPSLSPLASWIVEEHIFTLKADPSSFVPFQGELTCHAKYSFDAGPGSYEERIVIKRRQTSPPRPILPSLNINLDLEKILDLAAIGRAIFRSAYNRR